MNVTTKAVRRLDSEKLQAFLDDGWTHVSTRFNQEVSEIVAIRGDEVDVQFDQRAYATPIRIANITAVHKPDEVTSI